MQELLAARKAGASTLAEAEELIAQDAMQSVLPPVGLHTAPEGLLQVRHAELALCTRKAACCMLRQATGSLLPARVPAMC